jgi:hypothetical protein
VGDEIRGIQQLLVHRQRAFVVKIRRRDRRAVDLGLHEMALHSVPKPESRYR